MRNAQDHNAAISMAISIVSLPRHSPVRSQIFKWLEKSIQEQELPHHSNLEEIASTGLRKIEKIQEIERKADFLRNATFLVGTVALALAMIVAILSGFEILQLPRAVLISFTLLAMVCAINWSFDLLGMLPQFNTSNRSDLQLIDAEREIVWHFGEFGPIA